MSSDAEWRAIRNQLLGDNYAKQNVPEAIRRARSCNNKDAQWLASLFMIDTPTRTRARDDLCDRLEQESNPLARVFLLRLRRIMPLIKTPIELLSIYQIHEISYAAFLLAAFYHLFGNKCITETVHWANVCIKHGEPYGHFVLGNFHQGALEGDVNCMYEYGNRCKGKERLLWLQRAAICNHRQAWANFITIAMDSWRLEHIRYDVGTLVRGHIDGSTLFGLFVEPGTLDMMLSYTKFANTIDNEVRESINAWSLVAYRLGMYRDVRLLVARQVWALRGEFYR